MSYVYGLAVPCSIKLALAAAYDAAVAQYSEAVKDLNKNIGICAKDRYDVFYKAANEARQRLGQAKVALAAHAAAHRC